MTHAFSSSLTLSGNVFYRANNAGGFNGDINDDTGGNNLAKLSAADIATLTAAAYPGYAGQTTDTLAFPQWRCIAAILSVAKIKAGKVAGEAGSNTGEPAEKCTGIDTTGHTDVHETGISAQLAWTAGSGSLHNTLVGGFSLAESRAHFVQFAQFGYLNEQRSVTLVTCPAGTSTADGGYCDPFADGTEISDDGTPVDNRVDLSSRISTRSVYVSDVLSAGRIADFTVSGRYDYTKIRNRDGITPEPGPDSLTADNTFEHFNPGAGATVHLASWIDGYAGWNESSRAPTPIELGCDGIQANCRLPNAMSGDPPGALSQVITRTVELGLRGSASPHLAWSAGVFRGDSHNDIMFEYDDVAGYGHFVNFGDTRRQGLELSLAGGAGPVRGGANFTLLDATYRSPITIESDGNSTADFVDNGDDVVGLVQIKPGDRIPLVPRQQGKIWLDWDVTRWLSVDVDLQYTGWSYARGNENNAHVPGTLTEGEAAGATFTGPGYSGGYLLTNLGLTIQPVKHLKVFLQVDNLLDRRYHTASWLQATNFPNGASQFVNYSEAGDTVNGTFYSPGAPRAFFGGLRYELW